MENIQTIVYTVVSIFVIIMTIGVVWWSYSKRNKHRFDEDANMIFNEKDKNPGG